MIVKLGIRLISLVILSTIISCKENKIGNILIGDTLYTNQNYSKNKELRNLIQQTLTSFGKIM